MDPTRLLTKSCTVTHRSPSPTLKDGMGDPLIVTTTETFACWLSQESRSENTVNADVQQQTWSLYLEPAAVTVQGDDVVTVDAVAYEVDGPPWPAHNPRTSIVTHIEATVRRTT